MEASVYFLSSINNQDIIALSKTSYWEKRHKDIQKMFSKMKKLRVLQNCKACHSDIEKD